MIKNGTVVYNKSFGYNTYDSLYRVDWDQLYDIASVTKTVATIPALIRLVDQHKLTTEGKLGNYLPLNATSDKGDLLVRDILMHQSGLKSYIPFWRKASSDTTHFLYKKRRYAASRKHTLVEVNWQDSISHWINRSAYNSLRNSDGTYRYLYSDLGFMVMKEMVEYQTNKTFDQYLDSMLYRPMAMDFTVFNPRLAYAKAAIAPTEMDKDLRKRLVQGEVHDRNAALLGGVSGHAGLFSNANDLAKYMQMMMMGGYYGGKQFFDRQTVNLFATKPPDSYRRALGWDKPNASAENTSQHASNLSFGHSGFTGTYVWADPKYRLVYIFLSNRIYPDAHNNKLGESNIRTKIHDLMYESFLSDEVLDYFGM